MVVRALVIRAYQRTVLLQHPGVLSPHSFRVVDHVTCLRTDYSRL